MIKSIRQHMHFTYKNASTYTFIFFSFILLCIASMMPLKHDEIDSNALPVISLQYRGSVLIEQEDIDYARNDFPLLYSDIYTFNDLRASKLIPVTKETGLSYYFPIYPLFCIPLKIIFSIIGLPQDRTFSLTNALLIILALHVVLRYLKVSDRQKFFALLLLIINPVVFYVNYINYEVFMFSMTTISLVLYYNGHKKGSAFTLSLAGMSNPSIMAVGLVMIFAYIVKIFADNAGNSFKNLVKNNLKETLLYALSFTPCFAQFLTFLYYFGTINVVSVKSLALS